MLSAQRSTGRRRVAPRPRRVDAARRAAALSPKPGPSVSTRSSRDRTRPGRSRIASRRRCSRPPRRQASSSRDAHLLEPTSGNTGHRARARRASSTRLPAHLRRARRTRRPSARRLLELYGAEIVESPGEEGSNGAVRLALGARGSGPVLLHAVPVRERGEPARALRRHGRRDRGRARPRRRPRRRARHRRDADGRRRARCARPFPDVVVAAAEPLPGDAVMGLRSLEDGYVPPILDVSKLDRKLLVTNAEAVAGAARCCSSAKASSAASRPVRSIHAALTARRRARRGRRRLRPRRRRLEVPLRATSGTPTTSSTRWDGPSGGSPGRRASCAGRARARQSHRTRRAALVVTQDGVAERYVAGPQRGAASPYRFELRRRRPRRGSSRTRATSSRCSTRTSRRRRARRAPTSRTSACGRAARTSSTRCGRTSSPAGGSPATRSSRWISPRWRDASSATAGAAGARGLATYLMVKDPLHRRRVRVADERVLALLERDLERLRSPSPRDARLHVHAGPLRWKL